MTTTTPPDRQHRWPQAPLAERPPGLPGPKGLVLFFGFAIVGPVVRAAQLPNSHPLLIVAVGAVATGVLGALLPRVRWAVLPVALGVGAVLVAPQGQLIATWSVLAVVAAAWAFLDAPPIPG